MHVLELDQVSKSFGPFKAVDKVSFVMPEGSIFGLLGPNGAGKTTIIRMITGITQPDSGKILIKDNQTADGTVRLIGYMPEERGLYKKMKVGDQLMYLAQLRGLNPKVAKQKLQDWLDRFKIADWWGKKIEELSKGMQQKIQFIATVIHEPKILILDEPFSGLDPINTNLIKDEIYRLQNMGTSVIFSTHRMEQVEEICEYIVLINRGTNILEGNTKEIREKYKKNIFEVEFSGTFPESILSGYTILEQNQQSIRFQLNDEQNSDQLLQEIVHTGIHIKLFQEIYPSVNEIFIDQVALSNQQVNS